MGLSTIQWTDYSFNPWIGCRKVAPECANCYAETLDRNRYSKTLDGATKENPISHWGSGPRHRTSAANWKSPLKWNNTAICTACGNAELIGSDDCRKCGRNFSAYNRRRPRVFCASLSDWLDDENVPIEWLADLLRLIHDTPNLDWLLLTKRPGNWRARVSAAHEIVMQAAKSLEVGSLEEWLNYWLVGIAPKNVWIGVSAGADQRAALDIPAKIHFLSCEPMLRPMDTTHAAGFDWMIFGGESGSKARPCNLDWIRKGINFCRENAIAPFVKQLGSKSVFERWEWKLDDELILKDSHGGDMEEWPDDLKIREFPKLEARA